ncbi:hypothetical protein MPSI1_001582 [Malassezia psittaci]|uniref:SAPS-domain-containing protein n=1 Tax=Malassezia psittaci TaxID=1821823 RepID=A0AAF0JJX6_9BASI|nr:hypothetical protein MPSI1_001582 [Malassezia psittaci]
MFWRFGISQTSALTTLLDKPDVALEDVLNESDLLQECKSNNTKLVAYLKQPKVLRRLLDYVVGAVEVEEVATNANWEKIAFKYPYLASEVLSSEISEISMALLQDTQSYLGPFWENFLSMPIDTTDRPLPLHTHPMTSASYSQSESRDDNNAEESESSEQSTSQTTTRYSVRKDGPGHTALAGYWAKVNTSLLEKHPHEMLAFIQTLPTAVEGLVARFETPAVVDLLFRIIQTDDNVPDAGIIQWLADNDLITRVISLLSPHVSAELHKAAAEFLKAIISLSAPSPASLNQVSMQESFGGPGEMLISAGGVNNLLVRELASEENVSKMTAFMLDFKPAALMQRSSSGADSAMSTRKASGQSTSDWALPVLREFHSSDESAVEEDDDEDVDEDAEWDLQMNVRQRRATTTQEILGHSKVHRDSAVTVRPSDLRRDSVRRDSMRKQGPSQAALTSSFVNCAGVFIELIRKNNSDYFEQHLFHTLRNYLLLRQQEISGKRHKDYLARKESGDGSDKPDLTLEDLPFEDDEDIDGMEDAMTEVAEKMGIVHLGPLLQTLASRIPSLQEMMRSPKLAVPYVSTTLGQIEPLTQTRYCIAELYAEMLHCSNMVLLNREPNVGPQYSSSGTLLGGIEGLQLLARALQGDDGGPLVSVNDPSTSDANQIESTQPSILEDDQEIVPEIPVDPSADDAPQESPQLAPASSGSNSKENLLTVPKSGQESGNSSGGESSDCETDNATDDEDAKSIASALSSMSLADLCAQFASKPPSIDEDHVDATPGDYLKKQFYDFQVISTMVELFLNHPWNNFLHNVVYDIVQQLFNGDMNAGINKKLTIAAFEQAGLVDAILEGSRRNQESSKQLRRIRLAYMGHLNLIAEEVIKLREKYKSSLGERLQNCFPQPGWDTFVEEELRVSRAKEAMPLAGGCPNGSGANETNWSKESDTWYADAEGNNTFARYLSSQMRNESTEDDADNDDILGHLDDRNPHEYSDDEQLDEDNEWGPFADSHASDSFHFISTGPNSSTDHRTERNIKENLTPADWAAEFRRGNLSSGSSDEQAENDSDSDSSGSGFNRDERECVDSDDNASDELPYVDLHKPASLRYRSQSTELLPAVRDPELREEIVKNQSERWPTAEASKSSGTGTPTLLSEERLKELALGELPDDIEHTKEGLLRRRLSNGQTVTVPLDEADLFANDHSSAISDD